MAQGKRKRKTKTSKGVHGGARRLNPPLSEVQKVLMGGGMFRTVKKLERSDA